MVFFEFQYWCAAVVLFLTLRWLLGKLKIGDYGSRYVFITGCDTGFGNHLVKRLDGLGFNVFAGCYTEKGSRDLKAACSNRVSVVLLDVSDEKSIANARQHVEKNLPENKGLWAVVNNAGTVGTVAPLEWLTVEDVRRTIDVNLLGVIFVTKEFLPLIRRERGRVVNMASISGRIALTQVPYSASKFGVEGFSDQLRRDLYKTGVTVHIIEPGYFQTNLFHLSKVSEQMHGQFRRAPLEVQQYYGKSFLEEEARRVTSDVKALVSQDVYLVVDAYEHAISAKFPKARYVVGWISQLVFQPLWTLPEWLSDFLFCSRMAVPKGAK